MRPDDTQKLAAPAGTIVVLSAGSSPYMREVLAAMPRHPSWERLLVWSGKPEAVPRPEGYRVVLVAPGDFDHGGTRNLAVSHAAGDVVAFLSDDATPLDGWLEGLERSMRDELVGAVFGRHLPRPDADLGERLYRTHAYGPEAIEGGVPEVKSGAVPVSNANAGYRRSALLEVGGFPRSRFAEDRSAARALAAAGWKVAYAPDMPALHSHRDTALGRLRRGVSLGLSEYSAPGGIKTVAGMAAHGLRDNGLRGLAAVALAVGPRWLGLRVGRVQRWLRGWVG